MKIKCPVGSFCPGSFFPPVPCVPVSGSNLTCFQGKIYFWLDSGIYSTFSKEGMSLPSLCPPGTACITPQDEPIPAPPSFYMSIKDRLEFHPCQSGDWCSLQRTTLVDSNFTEYVPGLISKKKKEKSNLTYNFFSDMKCFESTYCSFPGVLHPIICPSELLNYSTNSKKTKEGKNALLLTFSESILSCGEHFSKPLSCWLLLSIVQSKKPMLLWSILPFWKQ